MDTEEPLPTVFRPPLRGVSVRLEDKTPRVVKGSPPVDPMIPAMQDLRGLITTVVTSILKEFGIAKGGHTATQNIDPPRGKAEKKGKRRGQGKTLPTLASASPAVAAFLVQCEGIKNARPDK